MDRLREYGRLAVAIAVLAAIIGVIWAAVEWSGYRLRLQAEADLARAERITAHTELIEERRQYVMLMPGIVAQLSDTAIAGFATLAGWVLSLGMLAMQLVDRWRR
jgi:hypothetical protein